MKSSPSEPAPFLTNPEEADTVYLYLAGAGSVGKALLRQLTARPAKGCHLHLIGACTSRRAAWLDQGVPPTDVPKHLAEAPPTHWPQILSHLEQDAPSPLIVIDATGSLEVARYYERLLRAGIHVVTPSKRAFTQEQAYFNRLAEAADQGNAHHRYETTVGAGLPVVQSVQDLTKTGDHIREIRGTVSGTLTFIFSEIRRGRPFSEAVQSAVERGYAEPDVRDDLSGEDVARKFTILARTAGIHLERSDVQVESLVPAALREASVEGFLKGLPGVDAHWRERAEQAHEEAATLQYVGRLSDGEVRVGVQSVPTDSPFGRLEGTDNLLEIYTDRYDESPLAIRGPGAGPEVTAAGVLADILKVARTCQRPRRAFLKE